jgi:hypothetical protein
VRELFELDEIRNNNIVLGASVFRRVASPLRNLKTGENSLLSDGTEQDGVTVT